MRRGRCPWSFSPFHELYDAMMLIAPALIADAYGARCTDRSSTSLIRASPWSMRQLSPHGSHHVIQGLRTTVSHWAAPSPT